MYVVNSIVRRPFIFFLTELSLEQVDTLWNCLVDIPECSDDLLGWFLNQAKSKDHHAMSLETFKHIFMEKVNLFVFMEKVNLFLV